VRKRQLLIGQNRETKCLKGRQEMGYFHSKFAQALPDKKGKEKVMTISMRKSPILLPLSVSYFLSIKPWR
jgi:hypothetical protein